jgi:chemotaxis protein MotB
MLQLLAAQLGKLPNRLSVEGHTDSRPYVSATGYSNWELSSDRANAARKLTQQSGVRADQVADVRGYADQRLRKPEDPESASNRRVSIVVKYRAPDDPVSKAAFPTAGGKPTPVGDPKFAASANSAAKASATPLPAQTKPAPTPAKPAPMPNPSGKK